MLEARLEQTRTYETRGDTVIHGLAAGLVGYATAALAFGVADVARGRSFFGSMAALGASLFYGASGAVAAPVTPPHVFAGNGTYLLVFVALGLLASWLAALADRGAQLWFLALFALLFVGFHVLAAAQLMAESVAGAPPAGMIWAVGVLALVLMGAYLLWRHPRLRTPERWDG